ncbi:MAG: sensor histidine kinase [Usitatibacter sp.]
MSDDNAVTLAAANDRLRVLSSRVISIQEEERRHISRELHDDVGQSLTALKMGLHRLGPLAGADAQSLLAECLSMAGSTLERVRQLAHDMRPPQLDLLGLEEAMCWLVDGQRAATGLDIKSHFNGLLHRRFSPEIEIACYRITQEALSNATRHAHANSILVTLEAGRTRLRLTVRDDGRGFDPKAVARRARGTGSLGLISMEERAALADGVLELRSNEGDGAMVRVTFTLSPPQE